MAREKKSTVKKTVKAVKPKSTAKKTAARKIITKKVIASKPVTNEAAAKAETAPAVKPMTPEERFMRIELEAYLLAEKDNFKADPIVYWVEAEKKVQ